MSEKTLKFVLLLAGLITGFPALGFGQPIEDPNYKLKESLPALIPAGVEISDTLLWWEESRRTELLHQFEREMYGRFDDRGIEIAFHLMSEKKAVLRGKANLKVVRMVMKQGSDSVSVYLLIYVPTAHSTARPVFLGLNFFGNHSITDETDIPITAAWVRNREGINIRDNKATAESRGSMKKRWPLEMIVEKGYALATMYYGELDPDYDDGFKNGIHSLTVASTNNSAISAWAFGLSKAVDYFEQDPDIDAGNVAVFGHSRLGKAALWAGALDERFALIISNNSGCGGAALSKRRQGETVRQINDRFPHWFSKNFRVFNDNETDLTFDQHMLLALMAPRAVYVASAYGDRWADPEGEFLSLYHAEDVYSWYGRGGIRSSTSPALNTPIWKGVMGYHIRSGDHDITHYDWEQYLNFADRVLEVN